MTDEQLIAHAKKAAKTIGKRADTCDFAPPEIFFRSFGFFKWQRKNKLTETQLEIYRSAYTAEYNSK